VDRSPHRSVSSVEKAAQLVLLSPDQKGSHRDYAEEAGYSSEKARFRDFEGRHGWKTLGYVTIAEHRVAR
jgi:hypothetical protein